MPLYHEGNLHDLYTGTTIHTAKGGTHDALLNSPLLWWPLDELLRSWRQIFCCLLFVVVVVVGGGGGADVMLDMCVCPYIPAECN